MPTITNLTALAATPATNDEIPLWDLSGGVTRKATIAEMTAAVVAGSGTMAAQTANAVAITGGTIVGLTGVSAVATTGGWGFTGDTDTYWGYSTTDTLAAVAGGTERLRITVSGGAPKLELRGDSGGVSYYKTDGTHAWQMRLVGDAFVWQDMVWDRIAFAFVANPTADTALTNVRNRFQVGGETNLGTLTVLGTSASAIAEVIRLASGATAHALTIENNSGTDLLSVNAAGRFVWDAEDTAPSDTATPDKWIKCFIGGTEYRLPLYAV